METERDRAWVESALRKELEVINGLPVDTNIKKPNNDLWRSLYRLAGLVSGSQLNSFEVLNAVKYASRHLSYTPKEMDYQWKRALDRAKPRQRMS